MKKFSFKEKFSKVRTVYVMAAVSICLTAVAIGTVYSQTMNTLEKNLTPISTTKQVHQNQTGEADPRKEYTVTVTAPTTQKRTEPTTQKADLKKQEQTENTAKATTQITTSASVSVSAVQSFIRPHDGEIIRAYSPEVPLYCETMNDWRTHSGIDIAVKEGDEALSVGRGTVSKVLVDQNYGYTVEVNYGNFTARYCGMKQGESVGIGQVLEKGDSVGVVDTVPCEAKAVPHLHFEVVSEGDCVDPLKAIGS